MTHNRICAWCERTLSKDSGFQSNKNVTESLTTHGICEICMTKMIKSEVSLETILNKIPYPVLVVSEKTRLVAVNDKGEQMLGKSSDMLRGKLGGDVIVCSNAKLPGGCGYTPTCKYCVLRNTVQTCLETGIVQVAVNDSKHLEVSGTPEKYNIQFTVEMASNMALVHIEQMDKIKRSKKIENHSNVEENRISITRNQNIHPEI